MDGCFLNGCLLLWASEKLSSNFADFEQVKKINGVLSNSQRNPKSNRLEDLWACVRQKLLLEKFGGLWELPCHASSHLVIYHECYRFESVVYSQAFFAFHSFLLFSRLPWGQQFNLKVSRALCCSWKQHCPGYLFESQQSTIRVCW